MGTSSGHSLGLHSVASAQDTSEKALEEIDRSIEDCKEKLYQLQKRRNECIPINRLPDDILHHIFTDVLIWRQIQTPVWPWGLYWRGFLTCRQWYQIFKDSRALLAYINWSPSACSNIKKALFFIDSSKQAKLRFRIILDKKCPLIASALVHQRERLAALEVSAVNASALNSFLLPFRNAQNLRLPNLAIARFSLTPHNNLDRVPWIPLNLMHACLDSLVSLNVGSVALELHKWPNLTGLILEDPFLKRGEDELLQLLTTLSALPKLATLVLGPNSIQPLERLEGVDRGRITFPALRILALTDFNIQVARCLKYLSLPARPRIYLNPVNLSPSPRDLQVLLDAVIANYDDLGLKTLKRLSVAYLNSKHLELSFGHRWEPIECAHYPDLRLTIKCRNKAEQKVTLQRVASLMSFRTIVWLDVLHAPSLSRGLWNAMLKDLPALFQITVGLDNIHTINTLYSLELRALERKSRPSRIGHQLIRIDGTSRASFTRSKTCLDALAYLAWITHRAGKPLEVEFFDCSPKVISDPAITLIGYHVCRLWINDQVYRGPDPKELSELQQRANANLIDPSFDDELLVLLQVEPYPFL